MSPVLYWSAMASISGLVLLEGVDSGLKYSGCLGDVTLSREMWAKSCRYNWELEDARCLLHSSQSGLGHPGSIFYLSGVIFFSLAFFLNFCYTVFSTWLYFVQCSAQATLRNPALKASILNTLWVLNCDNWSYIFLSNYFLRSIVSVLTFPHSVVCQWAISLSFVGQVELFFL